MKKLTAILLLLSLLLTPAWAEGDEANPEALAALPAMALDPETGMLYPSTVPPVKLIEDKTTREYEVLEYVRTSRNSNGEITYYTYDCYGNQTGSQRADARHSKYEWLYNADGKSIWSARYEDDGELRYASRIDYDENGQRSAGYDWENGVLVSQSLYDHEGYTSAIIWYNKYGNVHYRDEYIDDGTYWAHLRYRADGTKVMVSERFYNEDGNVIEHRRYIGEDGKYERTCMTYDDAGNKLTEEQYRKLGTLQSKFWYRSDGQLLRAEEYDLKGAVKAETINHFANGVLQYQAAYKKALPETLTVYDAAGNVIRKIDFDYGKIDEWTEYGYDERGNQILFCTCSPNGEPQFWSISKYDQLGHKILSLTSRGARSEYTYDEHGNQLRWEQYDNGILQTRTLQTFVDDTLRSCETWNLDADGSLRLCSLERFNAHGDMIDNFTLAGVEDIPNFEHYEYIYDPAGNIVYKEYYHNGSLINWTEYTWALTASMPTPELPTEPRLSVAIALDDNDNELYREEYDYTANGDPTAFRRIYPDGTIELRETREYDAEGRLAVKQLGETRYTYAYNAAGNLSERCWYEGDTLKQRWEIFYDTQGRKIDEYRYSGDSDTPSHRNGWEYDRYGHMIRETTYRSDLETPKTESRWVYEDGVLRQHSSIRGQQTTEYQYDEYGNVTQVSENGKLVSTTQRSYDAEGRPIQWIEYDAEGVEVQRRFYEYDAEGNTVRWGWVYPNGRRSVCYEDGKSNRLAWIDYNPDGTIDRRTDYAYSADGRRLWEQRTQGDGTIRSRTDYFYDADGNLTRVFSDGRKDIRYNPDGTIAYADHHGTVTPVDRFRYEYIQVPANGIEDDVSFTMGWSSIPLWD